jgi:hypothetical protein
MENVASTLEVSVATPAAHSSPPRPGCRTVACETLRQSRRTPARALPQTLAASRAGKRSEPLSLAYAWRKRLQESGPVRFALVERRPRRQERTAEAVLELVLATGERLRIGAGVDIATLRTVLAVLRA